MFIMDIFENEKENATIHPHLHGIYQLWKDHKTDVKKRRDYDEKLRTRLERWGEYRKNHPNHDRPII